MQKNKEQKRKNQSKPNCIKSVPGVICNSEVKDCDSCPFYKGIGIIPVFIKGNCYDKK